MNTSDQKMHPPVIQEGTYGRALTTILCAWLGVISMYFDISWLSFIFGIGAGLNIRTFNADIELLRAERATPGT